MDCPICGFSVSNARGLASHFRHQPSTHPDYTEWSEARAWEGKTEGADFVRCRECGFRASSLARHLGSVHGFSADEYREKHGADSPIRCDHTESKRRAGIKAAHARTDHKGQTKTAPCTACGEAIEIALFAAAATAVCEVCRNSIWDGKTEPKDFVICLDCGYRAENLTSHLLNAHPDYRERHPDALVVALCSAVRDKTALQGRTLPAEVRARMSANAGRWNKGLTKAAHPSLMAASEKMRGRPSWASGLTVASDTRLAQRVRRPVQRDLEPVGSVAPLSPNREAETILRRPPMIDLSAVQSVFHDIKASLDQVEQLILSSPNPGPGPNPGPDDGPRGFQPHEVGMTSSVLRASGAYAHVGNPDAFLGNFLGVLQGAPQPTSPSDIRAILDAALVVYSDGNGDGVADIPPFPSSVADSAWEILSQAFASQPPL